MTKPNVVENAPLIIPSSASTKSDKHRIYANEEGFRLLIAMCHEVLASGKSIKGSIRQNQQWVGIELIPSTEEGRNPLKKLLKRGIE